MCYPVPETCLMVPYTGYQTQNVKRSNNYYSIIQYPLPKIVLTNTKKYVPKRKRVIQHQKSITQ